MTRELRDHHTGTPCPVCTAIVEELAAPRLALHNATVDRDVAQMEASSLPHPRYTGSPL
jgi:hypothetical protein